MKREQLNSALRNYSSLAVAALGVGSANAGIIYTDVNPDQTFSNNGQFYDLDLNNDLTNDFRITITTGGGGPGSTFTYIKATPLNSNSVVFSQNFGASAKLASAMSASSNIGAGNQWANGNAIYLGDYTKVGTFTTSNGAWGNQSDKYLGLKLKVGANTYYGWIRMDVGNKYGSFTVKDYAYENTNNTTIKAGDMGATAMDRLHGVGISWLIDQENLIMNSNESLTGELSIIDMNGKTIIQKTVTNNSTKVGITELTNGIYFAIVRSSGTLVRRKFLIAR